MQKSETLGLTDFQHSVCHHPYCQFCDKRLTSLNFSQRSSGAYFRNMANWSNLDFKMWLTKINASGLTQEQLKLEAMKYSETFNNVDKKTISKMCDNFEKEHKKVVMDASHMIFEEMGGQEGKMRGRKDIPPKNYFPKDQSQLKMIKVKGNMQTKCEMCDILLTTNTEMMTHVKNKHEDALKKAFSKEVMSRVESHIKYLDWLKKDHIVKIMTSNHKDMNKEELKEKTKNHDDHCFQVTKDRTSGCDIIETKRTIIVPQRNGTEKKTVVKYQLANITTRTRDTENDDKNELGKRKHSEAERKQAKKITGILDHISGKDENTQASLISKVIDQKGQNFADKVTRHSKELQEVGKFSPEETAAVASGANMPDNMLTKLRTASNKRFGHNPFASHKKVAAARERILPISRFNISSNSLKKIGLKITPPFWNFAQRKPNLSPQFRTKMSN